MDAIQKRQLGELNYVCPESLLRSIQPMMEAIRQRPEAAKSLSKECLEKYHGGSLASMLKHILAKQMAGFHVEISIHAKEFEDSDCVIRAVIGDGDTYYKLVQLKHLPCHEVNDESDIQVTIEKLKYKYAGRIVSIWINRNIELNFKQLRLDGLQAEQLWFFGDYLENTVLATSLRGGFVVDLTAGIWREAIMRNGKIQISN